VRPSVRLAAFAATAAIAFGAAFTAGAVADPIASSSPPGHEPGDRLAPAHPAGAAADSAGLGMSDLGYTLRVADLTLPRGDQVLVSFRIDGPDGAAVRQYRATHEKEMHLILVRRDLSSFQHLHPVQDAGGTWTTTADLSAAGTYRLIADFAPAELPEQTLALGADASVPGSFEAVELPAPITLWADDGYEVALAAGPRAGEEAGLEFTVRRDGAPVTDLEPYLAAAGHLVALRHGDLAYLHTHPDAQMPQTNGPAVRFTTTFPTPGSYRLFLNFAHAGEVRTASFTIDVPAARSAPAQPAAPQQPVDAPSSEAGGEPGGHAGH
jgi:hypothetical protein